MLQIVSDFYKDFTTFCYCKSNKTNLTLKVLINSEVNLKRRKYRNIDSKFVAQFQYLQFLESAETSYEIWNDFGKFKGL
jgi:hypothetical protein